MRYLFILLIGLFSGCLEHSQNTNVNTVNNDEYEDGDGECGELTAIQDGEYWNVVALCDGELTTYASFDNHVDAGNFIESLGS